MLIIYWLTEVAIYNISLPQIVARVLQPQGVTVGVVNVAENMELVKEMGMCYLNQQYIVWSKDTEQLRY